MPFAPSTKLNAPSAMATYADFGQHVMGLEYMGATYAKLRTASSTALAIILSGDSTILGNGASNAAYQPVSVLPTLLSARGVKSTVTNNGHSGKATSDWLSTYLPAELLGAAPDVYVFGYLMNDPYFGISAAQSITNLRTGLALLRASWPASSTSVIIKMPNTASDDAMGRNEAYREAIVEGVMRACRDYGCAFVDPYGAFPEARNNLASGWLDAAFVHPNEDHYLVQWDMIAQVICPDGVAAMNGRLTSVTPQNGLVLGSEPMQVSAIGRMVFVQGFLQQTAAAIASGTAIATIPAGYRPATDVLAIPARTWNGTGGTSAANWSTMRCHVAAATGIVTTMEASGINVNRITLDGVCWRRT